jgi:hypothetical protein
MNKLLLDAKEFIMTTLMTTRRPSSKTVSDYSRFDLTPIEENILKCFTRDRSDDELIECYNNLKYAPSASDSHVRTTRKGLVTKGFLEETGTFAITKHGRKARVWRRKENHV